VTFTPGFKVMILFNGKELKKVQDRAIGLLTIADRQ